MPTIADRIAALDWARIESDLDAFGAASTGRLLSEPECAALRALYAEPARFRKRIVMARHAFGSGEYQYFASPLPEAVAHLRSAFYAPLAATANRWAERLGAGQRFPARHADYLAACHDAGQSLPTPLMLRYGPGDYNRLHQDLYGDMVFPLQVVIQLSRPGIDFDGGQFVLTEQRPRTQSRAEVLEPAQGAAVVFAVHHRPGRGAHGWHRLVLRHGVSRVHRGERLTLGLIFHDAA